MKYQVVHDWELSVLVKNVKHFIKHGWRPQGGISAYYAISESGNREPFYLQAMVKDEIKPRPAHLPDPGPRLP